MGSFTMESQTMAAKALAIREQPGSRASASRLSSPQKKKQRPEKDDELTCLFTQLVGDFHEDAAMTLEDQLIEPFIIDHAMPMDNRFVQTDFPSKEQEREMKEKTQMRDSAGTEQYECRLPSQIYPTTQAETRLATITGSPLQMEERPIPANLEAHTNLDDHYKKPSIQTAAPHNDGSRVSTVQWIKSIGGEKY
jgi:hypothetical protein